MVKKLSIGIIGIQGAISEHILSMKNTLEELNIPGNVISIKDSNQIENIDALIIPGGESTTISNILYKTGLYKKILIKIKENKIPIMGTCAGCVILASKLVDNSKDVKLLSAIDMKVKRNAFGRQRESFECNINIEGFKRSYNAVFIRAPIIEDVWGDCKILSKIDNNIVMVKQKNFIATSFHPELTNDFRIQECFLDMVL
jgi:5'-phosphate synthase pdxT subunit